MYTLSEKIKNAKFGAASNPYQGEDKKVLFVCSMGILRSATAARLYAQKYNTRSAGTYSEALIPITPILLSWADEIVFVSYENYWEVSTDEELKSYLGDKKVVILDIPDNYEHMNPELISAFKDQYENI